ncbi:IS630 family transposase [Consotaella aegiceratis]|uniref:IS630 family transposase n=1 Tax=Consotaella aegiceratis TaxID=3097961 RepID=UPI002F42C53F
MALEISDRYSAGELRAMARRETNGRVASRMLAIANALDGMSRADAARAAGMDRQTLRDWVVRYNEDGIAGLCDLPKGHPAPRLTEGELAALSAVIFRGPDPETDGVSTWTLSELCRWIEAHFGKSLHPASLSRILRQNGFSRQKTRPSHPFKDPKAQERFQKRGFARP